jgi:hypothetical protein
VSYRHEVFRDLEDPALFQAATRFTGQLSRARTHLGQLSKMYSAQQREVPRCCGPGEVVTP